VSLTQPELLTFTAHGTGNNNRADQFTYDNDGRTLQDNLNKYAYDAEGRLCAEQAISGGAVTLYLYDAEGTRVAKGGGSACVTASTTQSSFSPEKWFILDTAGQQMTEMDYGGGAWQWGHTNIFAGGKLLATYSDTGTACCNTTTPTTFALSDWLGTKRVQATATGAIDGNGADTFASLPYGDQEFNGTGATEQFFTGKERDQESGNDYFGARYYASSMGRMLSPDPHTGTLLHMLNPQRWNMYAYALNNPLLYTDPTGMDAILVNTTSSAFGLGHVGIASVHKDGTATYGEFGPIHSGVPIEHGQVNRTELNTKVEFGADGKPTQASLDALKAELAKQKNVPTGDIRLLDYPTSDDEASNLDNYIRTADLDSRWDLYDVTGWTPWQGDCRDFVQIGLTNASVNATKSPFIWLLPPNWLFDWLSSHQEGPKKEKVTAKIIKCTDMNGHPCS
jgi:RHS repeat-associated protein